MINEARALLSRLDSVQPFALTMPMVRAANIPLEAQKGINRLLVKGKKELQAKVNSFIKKLKRSRWQSAEKDQKEYALLKLKFNALLDQLDIFADVLTQRGEHDTGIWLAGMDALAQDALQVAKKFIPLPPLITYLDRGHGAAIRRARTRLPGGKKNPVAVIRVPRERMVSSGIASSLIHEVGHQGSALLDLINSVRAAIRKRSTINYRESQAWQLFERWISEILSDCWSVGMLGVGATHGLMGVVTLPRYFVFRMNLDDPHPFPWIRVKISCAFGEALFPDPQWRKIDRLWNKLYPAEKQPAKQRKLIALLEKTIPAFVQLVLKHRPVKLRGKQLKSIFPAAKRQPEQLRHLYQRWKAHPGLRDKASPSLVFAVLGQARSDHRLPAKKERTILTGLLRKWAMKKII